MACPHILHQRHVSMMSTMSSRAGRSRCCLKYCMLKVTLQSRLQLHSACLKAPEPGVVSKRAPVAGSALSCQLYQGSHVQWHAQRLLPAGDLQLCIAPHSGLLAFPFEQLDAQHLQLCKSWCCSMSKVVRSCSRMSPPQRC